MSVYLSIPLSLSVPLSFYSSLFLFLSISLYYFLLLSLLLSLLRAIMLKGGSIRYFFCTTFCFCAPRGSHKLKTTGNGSKLYDRVTTVA